MTNNGERERRNATAHWQSAICQRNFTSALQATKDFFTQCARKVLRTVQPLYGESVLNRISLGGVLHVHGLVGHRRGRKD